MKGKLLSWNSRYREYILLALAVLILLFATVNLHLDGSTITPGTYRVSNKNQQRLLSVNEKGEIIWDNALKDPTGWMFNLIFMHDGIYMISDDSGQFVTQAGDQVILQEQIPDDENQQWEIKRVGRSQYFSITNVASGRSICMIDHITLELLPFDKANEASYLRFV